MYKTCSHKHFRIYCH